ncbi:DUF2199 domain-containing protein [uncultured Chitinophaga sp.]|uniref:DUF2199 domain-containing protein n=1 Tax=uncultured Chitinophaga sp. TaxID=339340 RepID=UPI0025F30FDE|nr:DUF2199 domain-containing protein [uncultured Chitinophaga sp.]
MSKFSLYTCSACGKEHADWPALAFSSPFHYNCLTEEDKRSLAQIDTDFCVITYPDQTDRFIRCVLIMPVNDHCESLHYGLWVSLSEKSFEDYKRNYGNSDHETSYFGWLSNGLPGCDFVSVPMTVYTQKNGSRPLIVPHKDFAHPLVTDYYGGITKKEAEHRISMMLNEVDKCETGRLKKVLSTVMKFLRSRATDK